MAKYSKEMITACADWVRKNGLMDYGGATLTDFCAHFSFDNHAGTILSFSVAIFLVFNYFPTIRTP